MIGLRNKIAQMLIMGFSGYDVQENSEVVKWLQTDGLGGVLLFDFDLPANMHGKNLRDKAQIKRLNQDLNDYSALFGNALPLLIAVDYEGGVVDRLSKVEGCIKTMKPCEQAQLPDEGLYNEAGRMAGTLKDLGFNLNFAPVVDLNLNDQQGIIGKLGRCFSTNPELVSHVAKQFVQAFNEQGIACAYKHFPGHGSATGDTHEGFVDVTDTYQDSELMPYAALSNSTLPVMVMTAHVINRKLDPSGLPATLSYPILTGLLREKMGFDGVIISDDLQMQAISHHYSVNEALRLTINAGADMLIFGNQLGSNTATDVVDRIEGLVNSGAIELERIDEAYRRISFLKDSI